MEPVDPQNNRYPYSMVWGTLPLISWLLPCIGHLGVCDSRGRVHDFHAAYTIRMNRFMTGTIYRYYQFPQEFLEQHGVHSALDWDRAVLKSNQHYVRTVHNIVTNNCHHHVATACQNAGVEMTMFQAWVKITFGGSWVSPGRCCAALAPTIVLYGLIIGFVLIMKFFMGRQ